MELDPFDRFRGPASSALFSEVMDLPSMLQQLPGDDIGLKLRAAFGLRKKGREDETDSFFFCHLDQIALAFHSPDGQNIESDRLGQEDNKSGIGNADQTEFVEKENVQGDVQGRRYGEDKEKKLFIMSRLQGRGEGQHKKSRRQTEEERAKDLTGRRILVAEKENDDIRGKEREDDASRENREKRDRRGP